MPLVKEKPTTDLCRHPRHPSEILPQQKNWDNLNCDQLLCWALAAIECHCSGTSFWRTLEGYHLDKNWELEEDEHPTISKPQEFLEIASWAVSRVREAEGDPYLVRHPVMMLPQQDWQRMSENQMLTWSQITIETYRDNEWSLWQTICKYDDELSDYLNFTDENLLLPRAELLEIAAWTINRQWSDAIGLEYPAHLNTPEALRARFHERFEKVLLDLRIPARHRSDLARLYSNRVFYKQGCTQVEIEHILKPYYHFDLLAIAEEIARNLEVFAV